MNERKATKRALLTSITALVLCVVMLAGTTFAWFTDTAKTNVNRIEAGKLDVALEMQKADGTWADAEGETLNWVKATDAPADQAILWEPGAEYKLPDLKVVNGGNLKLKYKIVITGASGDVDLLNVIDFSASITGPDGPVSSNVNVRDNNPVVYDRVLKPNEEDVIALSGKMQTSANNTYMGKTISGISITVYAAQATGEYDSISDQYDAAAAYPTVAPVLNLNTGKSVTLEDNALPLTTITESGAVSTIPAGTTMQNGNNGISGTEGKLERVIKTTIATDPATGVDTATYDISYNFTQNGTTTKVTEFSEIVTNVLQLASGLEGVAVTHTHDNTRREMTPAATEDANTDGHFYYNKTTGKLTIWSMQYSAFAVSYKAIFAAVVNGQFFNTLSDAVAAAEDGDTITLLRDSNGNGIVVKTNTFTNQGLTVDFNGHTYSVGGVLVGSAGTGTNAFQLNKDNKITFKNGTIAGVTAGTKPAEDTPDWHGAPAIVIQNYCDLTLDNMTVSGGDETVYTMSNNNGNVTIKDTTINKGGAKGYRYGPFAFDVYGGFGSYDDVTVTVDGNSVINGDIELARDTESSNTNTNTLMLKNCTINGNILKSDGTLNFAGNVTLNGDVNVTDMTDAVANCTTVTEKTTLNLNGKIITPNNMGNNNKNFTALIVDADTTINAGVNGGIDTQKNGGYGINVRNGAKLTINGGTYYGGGTAVQAQKGFVTINDGNFAVEPYSNPVYGYKFMLNCIDEAYRDGEAGFTVYGGTYTGFDPSNSDSENPRASFVPEGYTCTKTGEDVWTVAMKSQSN